MAPIAAPFSKKQFLLKIIGFGILWFLVTAATTGTKQSHPAGFEGKATDTPPKDFSLKVAVEEVRIDAVVLDKKGRQIRDLTSDEFEIYQDGKPQKINSCTYVSEQESRAGKVAGDTSRAPAFTALSKKEVRRTLVFMVDDLSMAFEHFHYTRMALRKFVESQMQPGDLVVIFQSSGGALLQFSSDKRELMSRIEKLRWGGGRNGLIGCGPNGCGTAAMAAGTSTDLNRAAEAQNSKEARKKQKSINTGRFLPLQGVENARLRMLQSQIAILRYCLRTLQNMPGRKFVFFVSSIISYPEMLLPSENIFKTAFPESFYTHVRQMFDEVADEALRGGIVIHTLDAKGLDMEANNPSESYLPFSKKTGGMLIENSNFFVDGIGPVEEAMSGYYLLSFIPPSNTFDEKSRDVYRRIKVKVKRRGTELYSRDGYFGVRHSPDSSTATLENTLEQAIFSPFRYDDLKLSLASGYAYSSTPGYFLRSWLQVDGKDLIFTDESDGSHTVLLDVVTLTSNVEGFIQDSKALQYKFKVSNEDLPYVRKQGIEFNIYLPVKKAGEYYVRAAIRDRASGKIGSAYQYLSVPDISKKNLSLSSIFVLNLDSKGKEVKSELTNQSDSVQGWEQGSRSPAVRIYPPGERFNCMAYIYNAQNGKGDEPGLESQFRIFKDGKEYYKGKSETVSLTGNDPVKGIPIIKRFVFNNMQEGSYLLELSVTDNQAKKKFRTAVQAIDFEIRNNPEDQ